MKEAERRALHGDEVPIIRQGVVVATRTRYSDRLLAFLIARADRQIDALAPLPRDLHGDEDSAVDLALELLADVRGAPPAPPPQLPPPPETENCHGDPLANCGVRCEYCGPF